MKHTHSFAISKGWDCLPEAATLHEARSNAMTPRRTQSNERLPHIACTPFHRTVSDGPHDHATRMPPFDYLRQATATYALNTLTAPSLVKATKLIALEPH